MIFKSQNPFVQLLLLVAGVIMVFPYAQADMIWYPAHSKNKGAISHSGRAPKLFQLSQSEGAEMFLWKPNLMAMALKEKQSVVALKPTGMDNYHALVAQRALAGGGVEAAIRYVYMNGKPSGNSPRLLTAAYKTAFEIIPAPLPREHRRYMANHDVVFILRYEGSPVANVAIQLVTTNGTEKTLTSDRSGAVRFSLPDDFAVTKPGLRNNKPAEFVLSSENVIKNVRYRTSFSAAYYVDSSHWQSLDMGIAVLATGFIAGLAINRRNKPISPKSKRRAT